jgi:hypothetical protein
MNVPTRKPVFPRHEKFIDTCRGCLQKPLAAEAAHGSQNLREDGMTFLLGDLGALCG